MNIRGHWNTQPFAQRSQAFKAGLHARTARTFHAGSIGFVKAGLKHKSQTQCVAGIAQGFANLFVNGVGLQDAWTTNDKQVLVRTGEKRFKNVDLVCHGH